VDGGHEVIQIIGVTIALYAVMRAASLLTRSGERAEVFLVRVVALLTLMWSVTAIWLLLKGIPSAPPGLPRGFSASASVTYPRVMTVGGD
jgi:hypothetical protein